MVWRRERGVRWPLQGPETRRATDCEESVALARGRCGGMGVERPFRLWEGSADADQVDRVVRRSGCEVRQGEGRMAVASVIDADE